MIKLNFHIRINQYPDETSDPDIPNLNVDDTEMLRVSSDYKNISQCSINPAPIFPALSVLLGYAVKTMEGTPILAAGNLHWSA